MNERPPLRHALYHYTCEYDAWGVMESFAVPDRKPEPGIVKNFLDVRVPPKILPRALNGLEGQLEPLPDPGNWHADIAEWAAALLSVVRASGTYRIVELGCGWGCWMVNMGAAARARGLAVDLIGIEGDPGHLSNAREVLELNGFDDRQFSLHHGIAAPKPGKAIFPDPEAGTALWGGEAIFYPEADTLRQAEGDKTVQVLDCKTLLELSGHRVIDLLHIDIQGAEAEFVTGNMGEMHSFVRRVLIGTHSRAIEGRLCEHFIDHGWIMEMERPAIAPLKAGRPVIRIDGVQMWSNPALTGIRIPDDAHKGEA